MSFVFAKSSRTVPSAVPLKPVIGTDQVLPRSLVVGVPIDPPVVPMKGSEKSSLVTFATRSLNVTRYVTLVPFVYWIDGVARLMELNDGAVLTENELKLALAATEFPATSFTALAALLVRLIV